MYRWILVLGGTKNATCIVQDSVPPTQLQTRNTYDSDCVCVAEDVTGVKEDTMPVK